MKKPPQTDLQNTYTVHSTYCRLYCLQIIDAFSLFNIEKVYKTAPLLST